MRNNEKIKYAAITAMFAALITVTTAYVKIPAPLGYAHAGDSMIYLSASVLPGPLGFAAASIGGGLADLLAGYPQWAIPTAIIQFSHSVMSDSLRPQGLQNIRPPCPPPTPGLYSNSCPLSQ